MNRYIAFLRGINISGKNKVPMAELKCGFEKLGFIEVKTYLNSGNVIFSSEQEAMGDFTNPIETMLKKQFDFAIPVFVISQKELAELLQHAPDWWGTGDKKIYDNLIFMMPPATFGEVLCALGEPKKELEKIENEKSIIFWSFSRKDYQKTNWWPKTASASIRDQLTIRTANTVRKMVEM